MIAVHFQGNSTVAGQRRAAFLQSSCEVRIWPPTAPTELTLAISLVTRLAFVHSKLQVRGRTSGRSLHSRPRSKPTIC